MIDRRRFTQILGAAAAFSALPTSLQAQSAGGPLRIALLVHPAMVLLDLVGPQTVFSLLMAEVHLVGKERRPLTTDVGIPVTPTTTYAECPLEMDALFVPGGLKGSVALMEDPATLEFLADRGRRARFVTSVCTGSLLLGAAGPLTGYRATSHWYVRDLLPLMGATLEGGRVVEDRNRITGGGVTAGIDFGLTLAARRRGEDYARRVQLVLEYDRQPPFGSGSPERAGESLVGEIRQRRAPLIAAARAAANRARGRLGI
jgi:cyclohexyl-isocyanide hydratase